MVNRRGFLRGLVGVAGAAAVAPALVPKLARAMVTPVEAAPMADTTVRLMHGFIPVSTELLADYPNFHAEMERLLVDAYNETWRSGDVIDLVEIDPRATRRRGVVGYNAKVRGHARAS